jgi:hypothetical protein
MAKGINMGVAVPVALRSQKVQYKVGFTLRDIDIVVMGDVMKCRVRVVRACRLVDRYGK